MKVFVTGASGFIGSAVVRELIIAGHKVTGLARSDSSAQVILDSRADVLFGSIEDTDILKQAAINADAVIHTAFIHDFNQYLKAGEVDKAAIQAIGEALEGTQKPFVVTSGMLGLPTINGFITENSSAENSPRTSEATAIALANEKGIYTSVIRLPPSVHDRGDKGFIPFIIEQARKNGISPYPGDGKNCWSSVHRLDAAKAFRLAVERAAKAAVYNVVGDNAIETKKIAELISEKLDLPVKSLTGDDLANHFDWMARFFTFESSAISTKTRQELSWEPTNIGLLEDMRKNYF